MHFPPEVLLQQSKNAGSEIPICPIRKSSGNQIEAADDNFSQPNCEAVLSYIRKQPRVTVPLQFRPPQYL